MSKANNILDLKELAVPKHKELVELAYNLPPHTGLIGYLYSFTVFLLQEDNFLCYLPKRIQNKANKFIADFEKSKAQKEQAEPQPPISDAQKEVNKLGTDLIANILNYVNDSNVGYAKKVFVLEKINKILVTVIKENNEGK